MDNIINDGELDKNPATQRIRVVQKEIENEN